MAQVNFVYDSSGNIISATTTYPQVEVGQLLLVADDSDPTVTAAKANPSHYAIQNNQLVQSVTATINRTPTVSGIWTTYTIGVSFSDGQAHTATLQIGSNTQTIKAASNTATVKVHQSVLSQNVPISVTGQGIIPQSSFVGGNETNIPTQMYTDASGDLCVAPTSKAYLAGYWASTMSQAFILPDIQTVTGLSVQLLLKLITWAKGLSTGALTLDANTDNLVTDLQSLEANYLTTLENAAPVPASGQTQTYDTHYNQYRIDVQAAKTAMDNYVGDVNTIPNLAA